MRHNRMLFVAVNISTPGKSTGLENAYLPWSGMCGSGVDIESMAPAIAAETPCLHVLSSAHANPTGRRRVDSPCMAGTFNARRTKIRQFQTRRVFSSGRTFQLSVNCEPGLKWHEHLAHGSERKSDMGRAKDKVQSLPPRIACCPPWHQRRGGHGDPLSTDIRIDGGARPSVVAETMAGMPSPPISFPGSRERQRVDPSWREVLYLRDRRSLGKGRWSLPSTHAQAQIRLNRMR